MAGEVIKVDDSNWEDEVASSEKPVLVDFWAAWCGPCRVMAPVIEELASKHGDKIKVAKLNVDENSNIAQKYGIMSIPTFLLFKDGEVEKQIVGAMSLDKLVQELDL